MWDYSHRAHGEQSEQVLFLISVPMAGMPFPSLNSPKRPLKLVKLETLRIVPEKVENTSDHELLNGFPERHIALIR